MNETLKFVANGIFAAFIHFFFLITFTTYTDANYGFSNFIACIFGSISSFLGNKYFVFTFYDQTAQTFVQFFKFLLLYFLLCFKCWVYIIFLGRYLRI
jgi:putative flippase GtrA